MYTNAKVPHMEAIGQLVVIHSLFPTCVLQIELRSSKACWQAPLAVVSSCWPLLASSDIARSHCVDFLFFQPQIGKNEELKKWLRVACKRDVEKD